LSKRKKPSGEGFLGNVLKGKRGLFKKALNPYAIIMAA
jgi:hypothetical protein